MLVCGRVRHAHRVPTNQGQVLVDKWKSMTTHASIQYVLSNSADLHLRTSVGFIQAATRDAYLECIDTSLDVLDLSLRADGRLQLGCGSALFRGWLVQRALYQETPVGFVNLAHDTLKLLCNPFRIKQAPRPILLALLPLVRACPDLFKVSTYLRSATPTWYPIILTRCVARCEPAARKRQNSKKGSLG
jgi:hypothetical protein